MRQETFHVMKHFDQMRTLEQISINSYEGKNYEDNLART